MLKHIEVPFTVGGRRNVHVNTTNQLAERAELSPLCRGSLLLHLVNADSCHVVCSCIHLPAVSVEERRAGVPEERSLLARSPSNLQPPRTAQHTNHKIQLENRCQTTSSNFFSVPFNLGLLLLASPKIRSLRSTLM
jgi:hypothetical protein